MKIAVYPGSFDPVTLGHINIIERAAAIFDRLYVCVMVNSDKKPKFTQEERADMIRRSTAYLSNVVVETSDGLLVDYAESRGACAIVKGLRAVSDFDSEFQMALANKKLNPSIETMFLASSEKYTYLSSTIAREMAKYGADLTDSLPAEIIDEVSAKLRR